MKEAVFCSSLMLELGFDESFGSVPMYIDNTSALHVAGNRTCSSRAKHITPRYFFLQALVEEGKRSAFTTSRARISWQTWAPQAP